jgi:hypothetical protein
MCAYPTLIEVLRAIKQYMVEHPNPQPPLKDSMERIEAIRVGVRETAGQICTLAAEGMSAKEMTARLNAGMPEPKENP